MERGDVVKVCATDGDAYGVFERRVGRYPGHLRVRVSGVTLLLPWRPRSLRVEPMRNGTSVLLVPWDAPLAQVPRASPA